MRPIWSAAGRWSFPQTAQIQLAPGITFDLDLQEHVDVSIYRGLYDRPGTQIVSGILRQGQTAIDVGANIGYFTALMGRAVGPLGRVIALEPSPTALPALKRLCAQPSLRHVEILECAAGAYAGEGHLGLAEPGQAGLSSMRAGFAARRSTAVAVQTLDDVVRSRAVDEVNLVKIDVEGLEGEVLAGAARLLADGRVAAWMLELSPEFGSIDWFATVLRSLGERYAAFRLSFTARGLRVVPVLTPIADRLPDRQVNVLLLRNGTPLPPVVYASPGS